MRSSSNQLEQRLSRAEFFKWGSKSIKKAAGDFLDRISINDEEEIATIWNKLVSQDVVGAKPRLYFTKGQPFFVVNLDEKGPQVFGGTCAEDGGLLEWREGLQKYCCPFCRSSYDREGKSVEAPKISLARPDTRVVNGFVMVKLSVGI